MNKKLLTSLGSLSTISIVAPILITVSCASENPTKVEHLVIIPRTNPKLVNNNIDSLKGTDLPAQLIALHKLFGGSGLTSANQNKFNVGVDENRRVVTLTTNPGFTISGKPVLESNQYTIEQTGEITDLNITAITGAKLTEAEVATLKNSDINVQWPALEKLFGGKDFVLANKDKFIVALDEAQLTVTLIANTGLTIGGNPKLSNTFTIDNNPVVPTDLAITAKSSVQLTTSEVNILKGSNDNAKWTVYAKLFDGADFKVENKDKFTITFDENSLTVTLTAATNFSISGQKTLSNTFTIDNPVTPSNLIITAKASIRLNGDQIINLTSTTAATQLSALRLLFEGEGLIEANLSKFDVSTKASTNIVTLTAKPSFTINGQPNLESKPYTVANTALDTTKLASTKLTAQQVAALDDPNTAESTLRLLFSHISGNMHRFTYTVNKTTRIVTLTGKQGFIFKNSGSAILTSLPWINA
ncbi:MAG: hypothetical protein ACRDAW_01940 [Metamycoplasmataceae bacterium]